jgi:hypothetical protein
MAAPQEAGQEAAQVVLQVPQAPLLLQPVVVHHPAVLPVL